MPYSKNTIVKVLGTYDAKNRKAKAEAEERRAAAYTVLPALEQLDRKLSMTCIEIVNAVVGGGDISEQLGKIKERNLSYQYERAELLKTAGLSPDFAEPVYECPGCCDTGYIETEMCSCLRKALALESFRSSGLGEGSLMQTFASFSLDYYSSDPESEENMRGILEICRTYAREFGDSGSSVAQNLLFVGPTGLGKTHLSSAIAHAVIEKGYEAVYDSAQNIIYSFEKERFGNLPQGAEPQTERFLQCGLLIIDDLGTEYGGSMSVSSLYNLLNTRLVAKRSTIISTNLTLAQMQKKYDDRINSRLLGEFEVLNFFGEDVRMQKLSGTGKSV